MDIYKVRKFGDAVEGNKYPGRGIVVGQSCDGTKAVIAYFIMGRSVNSRNRVFVERDGAVFTEPFDVSTAYLDTYVAPLVFSTVKHCYLVLGPQAVLKPSFTSMYLL